MDKGSKFLHNHPITENRLGLDDQHVIVDRDAWEEARARYIESYTPDITPTPTIDKIHEFTYTSCIHESAMATISLHKSKKGAEAAMELHKNEERKKWLEMFYNEELQKEYPFGDSERWDIRESKLQE